MRLARYELNMFLKVVILILKKHSNFKIYIQEKKRLYSHIYLNQRRIQGLTLGWGGVDFVNGEGGIIESV